MTAPLDVFDDRVLLNGVLLNTVDAELAPRRVNCVSPGVIDTPMFSKFGAAKDERLAAMTAGNPIARPGAAEEVAAAVVFALENAYMTGAVLEIDGGLVVAPPK